MDTSPQATSLDAAPCSGETRVHAGMSCAPASVGQLLGALRAAQMLSLRAVARRARASHSTVIRLERGDLRPRPSLLAAVAWAINPDEAPRLFAELVAAAADDLAPDTEGWRRYRAKRLNRGMRDGTVPVPSDIARAAGLHRQADAARHEALSLLTSGGNTSRARELLAECDRLRAEAGPAMMIRAGSVRVVAGVPQPDAWVRGSW